MILSRPQAAMSEIELDRYLTKFGERLSRDDHLDGQEPGGQEF
jgi:hypothetical protein